MVNIQNAILSPIDQSATVVNGREIQWLARLTVLMTRVWAIMAGDASSKLNYSPDSIRPNSSDSFSRKAMQALFLVSQSGSVDKPSLSSSAESNRSDRQNAAG